MTALPTTPQGQLLEVLKDKRLVLVDDDEDQLCILKAYLRNKVAKLESFVSGVDALQHIKGKDFDLMILDVMMPDCDGWEIYNRMRQEKDFKDMPVIFLSCLMNEELVRHTDCPSRCAGLPKPVDLDQLMHKMIELLEAD